MSSIILEIAANNVCTLKAFQRLGIERTKQARSKIVVAICTCARRRIIRHNGEESDGGKRSERPANKTQIRIYEKNGSGFLNVQMTEFPKVSGSGSEVRVQLWAASMKRII